MAKQTLTSWMVKPRQPFYKQPWYWSVVGVGAFFLFKPKKAQASVFLPRSPASGSAGAPSPPGPAQAPRAVSIAPRELALSQRAGVPVAVLRAIAAKESTRTPPPAGGWPTGKGAAKIHQWGGPKVMRFEPHVFNRKVPDAKHMPCTRKGMTCAAAKAADKGSASTVESEVRISAFREAFKRDPRAAIESTSWGRFQVMGSNFLKSLYNNDPSVFLNAWINADYNQIEDMGDSYLAEWFRARPDVREYANMPMDKGVRYGGKDRRVVDVLARRYNGSYSYANDSRSSGGTVKPGLMSTYRAAVAQGAPTTLA